RRRREEGSEPLVAESSSPAEVRRPRWCAERASDSVAVFSGGGGKLDAAEGTDCVDGPEAFRGLAAMCSAASGLRTVSATGRGGPCVLSQPSNATPPMNAAKTARGIVPRNRFLLI